MQILLAHGALKKEQQLKVSQKLRLPFPVLTWLSTETMVTQVTAVFIVKMAHKSLHSVTTGVLTAWTSLTAVYHSQLRLIQAKHTLTIL